VNANSLARASGECPVKPSFEDIHFMMRIVNRQYTATAIFMGAVALAYMYTSHPVRGGAEETSPGLVQEQPANRPFVETAGGFMVPYTLKIPGSEVSFEMVPVAGGRFTMGSPESESGRSESEGPQVEIQVAPFWIGKHEVTWGEYKLFMNLYKPFKDLQSLRRTAGESGDGLANSPELKAHLSNPINQADAITIPTPLYDPSITFEHGEDPRQPAATMTQYAAKQYTKWLSVIVGHDYRLPTEAEWEYACRAGTQKAYYFGDNADELVEHAWYFDSADERTHVVGEKEPNPWGLYDMYGNVAEWTIDGFSEDGYAHLSTDEVTPGAEAVAWPTKVFPRVLRGGHWDDDAEMCRSASRMASNDPEFSTEDPNIPLSPWWFAGYPSSGIGFRLVRPAEPLSKELKGRYWEADVEDIQLDVEARLDDGRGAQDNVTKDLPKTLKQLEKVTSGG
jgi:sulfatase modifying factor 1